MLIPKHKQKSLQRRDGMRSKNISRTLSKISNARKISQLKQPQDFPKARVAIKGRVMLNRSGNLTGMHHAKNPPDSAQMKKIRAMRKFYNRQMPVLQCSNCAFSTSCPQYKAGFECAYLPFLNSHAVNNETELMEAMKNVCEAQLSRAHRQSMMETLTGGMPSLETTEGLNIAFMNLKILHDKMMETNSVEVSVESGDGTIIGRLFGSLESLVDHTKTAHTNPIEVAPEIVDTSDKMLLPEPAPDVDTNLVREHTRDTLENLTGKSVRRKSTESKPMGTVKVSEIKI